MEKVIISIILIDFVLLFIGKIIFYLRAFKILSFKDLVNKIEEAFPKKIDNDKEKVDWKDKTLWQKILFVFKLPFKIVIAILVSLLLILLGLAIGIGIPTAGLWGTVWIGSSLGMFWAIVFLILINIFYFFGGLGMLSVSTVPNKTVKKVLINDVIKFSMYILALYFVGYSYDVSISNLIIIPYEWNIQLNNIASIGISMVFYAILFTNIFALGIRFNNILRKDINKHRTIELYHVMFIFISACFLGILMITDVDFSFMSELERVMYFETLEVVKWIVTSVFIPLFIYLLNNSMRKVKSEVHDNRESITLEGNMENNE